MWHGAGNALAAVVLAFAGGDADFEFVAPPKLPAGPPQSQAEMDAAKAYLVDFGASKEALRVAFDVLMFAAVAGDKATADEMRTRLILEHPESLQHRFLLTTLDAKAYRELLVAESRRREFTKGFSEQFCRAVGAGSRTWTTQFLTDDFFLMQCAVAAQGANEKPLLEFCRTHLTASRDSENEVRRKNREAAAVLFDESLTVADKCLALHAVEDNPSAQWLEAHFDSRLTDELRDRADLVEARVERWLDHDGYSEALPVVERLLESDGETPKRLFWRAWCEAATENPAAADHFRDLVARFPEDPWAIPARLAAQAVVEFDANVNAQAEAAAAAIRQAFTEEVKLIEAHGEWKRASGAIDVYASADLSEQGGEAILRKGEAWLAALRIEPDGTRLLLDGETSINVFRDRLPFNVPRPKLMFDPVSRKLDFNASFSTDAPAKSGGETADGASIDLLQHMQPSMILPLVQGYVNKGWLPIAAQSDATGATYGWIEFSARKPEIQEWKVRITNDHHLATIDGPTFSLRSLKYGPAGSFGVSPPMWPELPVVEHEKFDPSVMFRAMAALTKLWSDDETPVATTTAQSTDAAKN